MNEFSGAEAMRVQRVHTHTHTLPYERQSSKIQFRFQQAKPSFVLCGFWLQLKFYPRIWTRLLFETWWMDDRGVCVCVCRSRTHSFRLAASLSVGCWIFDVFNNFDKVSKLHINMMPVHLLMYDNQLIIIRWQQPCSAHAATLCFPFHKKIEKWHIAKLTINWQRSNAMPNLRWFIDWPAISGLVFSISMCGNVWKKEREQRLNNSSLHHPWLYIGRRRRRRWRLQRQCANHN